MDELNHSCARFLIHSVGDCFGHHVILAGGVQDLSEPRLSYHAKLHVYKSSLCAAVGWGLWCGAVDEIYKQEFSTARKILVPHIRGMSPEDARR